MRPHRAAPPVSGAVGAYHWNKASDFSIVVKIP